MEKIILNVLGGFEYYNELTYKLNNMGTIISWHLLITKILNSKIAS